MNRLVVLLLVLSVIRFSVLAQAALRINERYSSLSSGTLQFACHLKR